MFYPCLGNVGRVPVFLGMNSNDHKGDIGLEERYIGRQIDMRVLN